MCLHCPDCGCNMKTWVKWYCVCAAVVERSTTRAAERTSRCWKSNRCPKQRLVLPLVENTNHDIISFYSHHPSFVVVGGSVCLLRTSLTHCWHARGSPFSVPSIPGLEANFLGGLFLIWDQIILSLHSFVSTFIRYCLRMIDTLWVIHGNVHTHW